MKDLGELVKAGTGQPYQLTIDLSQAIADMPFSLAGRVFAIWSAPTSAENILVRFNKRDAHQIMFTRGKVLAVPYTKLYITVPAGQAGTMQVLYGPDAFDVLRIYPNAPEHDAIMDDILTRLTAILAEAAEFGGIAQPAIIITNVAADANTVGADHDCTAVLVRSWTTNTGLVWVDFQEAAVEHECYPLDPGDAISVKLSNTDLVNVLFKIANEDVTVIYQN